MFRVKQKASMMVFNSKLQQQEQEEERSENESESEERWIKYYSSFHEILLVGDGDFSFSLCLAKSFGSASNIVATCLDQYDVVISKYKHAKSNLESLKRLGATVMHGVDVTKMKLLPDLQMRKFDRIIYNFPHAGFHGKEDNFNLIRMHRNLVQSFFRNASGMLRPFGEVHVNHKMTRPFNNWNLEELASRHNLQLIECVEFKREDYPGYCNKRGSGPKCDESFPLGECCTFKFVFSSHMKKIQSINVEYIRTRPYQIQRMPLQTQNPYASQISLPIEVPEIQKIPSQTRYPNPNCIRYPNEVLQVRTTPSPFGINYPMEIPQVRGTMPLTQSPYGVDIGYPAQDYTANRSLNFSSVDSSFRPAVSEECSRIFDRYFSDAVKSFGKRDYTVGLVLCETLRTGFDRFMAEVPGRTINGYISHLEELHRLSILRSEWLQRILNNIDKEKME